MVRNMGHGVLTSAHYVVLTIHVLNVQCLPTTRVTRVTPVVCLSSACPLPVLCRLHLPPAAGKGGRR